MREVEYEGYKIVTDTYGYKEIKPAGRGSIHLNLRGKFTTEKAARKAIDLHNFSKVSKDDKAN